MEIEQGIKVEVVGRITTVPEFDRTLDGVAVCRFKVATEAAHPMLRSLVKEVWVVGDPAVDRSRDLPVRVKAKLGLGDLVRVPGSELQRLKKVRGVEYVETAVRADDVRLKERGPAVAAA